MSHGAASNDVAMTEPRPRLTNNTGSVQQMSVDTDDARPTALIRRTRILHLVMTDTKSCDGSQRTRANENQISRVNVCRCGGSCGRVMGDNATAMARAGANKASNDGDATGCVVVIRAVAVV